jgi:hypothetical protein
MVIFSQSCMLVLAAANCYTSVTYYGTAKADFATENQSRLRIFHAVHLAAGSPGMPGVHGFVRLALGAATQIDQEVAL